jgi:(1->4)-alpha-D-glucan 1-alpha-D-glucosylmutase
VRAILDRSRAGAFRDSFESFARRTSLIGALNSLTQLILKATMPGVPDFYQGSETWDLSLVDPDNRRPVDFALREAALKSCAESGTGWKELIQNWTDGRIKLALTHRLLHLRNAMPLLFRGDYKPIEVIGRDRDHVVAFERSAGGNSLIVAVGRHFAPATGGGVHWPASDWQGELNSDLGRMTDALDPSRKVEGRSIAQLFAVHPFAVLCSDMSNARPAARM